MAYTIEQVEAFASDPHAPDVWRQLLETMREKTRLRAALAGIVEPFSKADGNVMAIVSEKAVELACEMLQEKNLQS